MKPKLGFTRAQLQADAAAARAALDAQIAARRAAVLGSIASSLEDAVLRAVARGALETAVYMLIVPTPTELDTMLAAARAALPALDISYNPAVNSFELSWA